MQRYSDEAYALLRIVAGFMFTVHGLQKIFGLYSDMQIAMFSQAWVGGIIELAGGLCIFLGFKTRLAAFLCSGMMAVAYFQFHWKFQWDKNFLPPINRGELAVLYCFVFFFIAAKGPGKWALDRKG